MKRPALLTALAVVVIAAVALVVVFVTRGDSGRADEDKYGAQFPVRDGTVTDANLDIAVQAGQRFSIVVRDNASIGDHWSAAPPPDGSVVASEGRDHVRTSSPDSVGGGGRTYFVFTAKQAGSATIALLNRLRGGKDSYTVTVRLTVS